MHRDKLYTSLSILLTVLASAASPASPQMDTATNKEIALEMWSYVAAKIEMRYYDPQFHGIDWKRTVRETERKIKSTQTLDMGMAYIEEALLSLNDSHTIFLPPMRPFLYDYGYQMEMIGDRCYIIRVRPGSDAEAKGLKAGDELLGVDGLQPVRKNMWTIDYRFNALRIDQAQQLIVRDRQGSTRRFQVLTKFKQLRDISDVEREAENRNQRSHPRWDRIENEVCVVKLPTFSAETPEIDTLIDKARNCPALILDLRGNGGGALEALDRLVGGMFEKDVKVADVVGRKGSKPQIAQPRKRGVFAGKLVVLVDSRSGSASELFARVVQIEKRGLVVGDRSAGAVMQAQTYNFKLNSIRSRRVYYGVEITEADLIMSDGKSLEHTGVTPDELVLPTAADLAAGRDPALARAAALLGAILTPEDAGRMFPYEWAIEQ